jgi:hypothetical protein
VDAGIGASPDGDVIIVDATAPLDDVASDSHDPDAGTVDADSGLDWSTISQCLNAGSKVLYISDDTPLHVGPAMVDQTASWYVPLYEISVRVVAGDWVVAMQNVNGGILKPGTYFGTSRTGADPLFGVDYKGMICPGGGIASGSFTIFDISVDHRPYRITAAFEQQCPGSATVLHGCVHYEGDGN